ncbi:uncharacterized protein LOC106643390 [Copidosoma floridanum]|uniref:uncharacterized protein LOC106643390 n=1 Tax=Copidosoma floridanum TaxID=29053 RepID=UPI000C6FBB60|nr:uncharacterized protein LOC106643390 [Copidosoma floridanum]
MRMMSCLTKPQQYKYLSCDAKEKSCCSADDEDGNDFDFQHVPVKEFKHVVRDVQRQRNQNKEEVIWTTFLKEQEHIKSIQQDYADNKPKYKSTRTLAESLEEVDRELMRLESDSLLESRLRTEINNFQEKHSSKSLKKDSPPTKDNDTGSNNFLLAIPEEENCYHAVGSSDSHRPNFTDIRKSCSARTFKNDRVQCRCYHYNSDLNYHSSPDISPDRFSNDDDDSIPVHPDPVAVSKILALQKKISVVLDSILFELDRIPLPDGENDLLRRQQRVAEFSTRLSRNYLYDLSRQISDIQRHIKATAPDSNFRLSRRAVIMHMQAIEQKLIGAHQLLLTALSAYWKHIPSSVMKNHPGKLKNILQVVVQLKNICLDIQLTSDIYCSGDDRDTFLGTETENRCIAILSKFRPNSGNCAESQVPSHSAKSTIATPSRVNKKRNRKTAANRYNMYTTDMKLAKAYLPKHTRNMFQVPRRHSQASGKQSGNVLFKKSNTQPAAKSSCEALGMKVNKINVPVKEDEIQTMMETVQQDLDAESLISIKLSRKYEISNEQLHKKDDNSKITKEYQKVRKSRINNENEIERNEREKGFSFLLPMVENLLSLVESDPDNTKTIPKNSMKKIYEYLQLCQPKTNSSKSNRYEAKDETISGEKNMRLISYRANEDDEKKLTNFEGFDASTKYNNASCQANHLNNDAVFELLLSESTVSHLVNYRKEYHCTLESYPMYTSTTQNKPWDIVSWIADKLLDELIAQLADDFQMDDVIQKLFDLEFQEL